MPHVGLPAKTAGPWRAWGRGLPGAGQGRGSPGGCAGEVREGVEEGQGADAGAGSARWRAAAGRPPGRGGGRSPGRGAQVLLTGAPRGPPAGAGGRRRGSRGKAPQGVHACRADPLEGVGEIRRRAPPRTRPSGPSRVAMSATGHRPLSRPGRGPRHTRPVHGQWAGPGLRSSIKIRRAGGRGGGRARASSRPVTVAHCGPVLEAGSKARTVEHDRCAHGAGPHPLDPPASPTRRITSAPGAAVDAIPPPRAGHGASRAGRSSPATARCGGPGTRGIHTSARSRPHGKNDQATIKTREATTWCAATPPRHRHGHRRRAPGTGPPAGAGPTPESTTPAPTRKPIGWGAGRAGRRKHPASTRRLVAAHRRPEDWPDPPQPGPDPQRPARHPQGHPGRESFPGRPRLCRQSQLRHRRSSAGILTRDTPEP